MELIASTIVSHHASLDQLSQAGANRGGAQAAELAQLLHSDGLIQAGQDLLDALERNGRNSARHPPGPVRQLTQAGSALALSVASDSATADSGSATAGSLRRKQQYGSGAPDGKAAQTRAAVRSKLSE